MKIDSRLYNGVLYVNLSGELDEYNASLAKDKLDEMFQKTGFNQIVIDLSELDFMDSTGIGMLIGRYKKMKVNNKKMYVCNPSKHIDRIFKMTGLYEIMPLIA